MLSNNLDKTSLKRKRVVLPIETKLQIVDRVMNGEAFTKLSSEYGIGTQTCRDIFRNRDKLVNFAFSSGTVGACLKRKTVRKANFYDIDKAVYQWFQQQRSEGIPITGPMLIEKALWFHKEMKIDEPFAASSGWLSKFKARYNIRQPKTKDDKLVADEPIIDKFKTEFKRIVTQNNFTLDQIYLADEKELYWNFLKEGNKITDMESVVEESSSCKEVTENYDVVKDDCITVTACANANGSRKLKLFCTGKCRVIQNKSALVDYYMVNGNKDSYDEVFNNWFTNIFIPEVKKDLNEKSLPENALLVMKSNNNNSIENDIQIKSESCNFFIMYLPKIITELPQMSSCSKDIIKHYVQNKLIPMIEDCNYIKNEYRTSNIPLDEIFCVLSDAWNNIKNERMQHSSWFWNNLFTEMEKEDIIEVRESITTHFMTLLDNMITDQSRSMFLSSEIDDSKNQAEESNCSNEENDLGICSDKGRSSQFIPTIDNIKIEVKEENGELVDNKVNVELCQKETHLSSLGLIKTEISESVKSDLHPYNNSMTGFYGVNNDKIGSEFSPSDSSLFKSTDNNLVSNSQIKLKVVTTSDAISCTDMLLKYLEQQSDSSYNDVLIVKNIRKKLQGKLRNSFVECPSDF